MTTTLVDRYVYTALRRIPEQQRADIDRELRASIEDAVEARIEAGEPREAAVEATLLELGDPDRLADSYADRPNVLIGPELYGLWRRAMVTLFATVLPVVVVIATIVRLFDDEVTAGHLIGGAISNIITVGAQLAFWTTLAFAVLERTGLGREQLRGGAWTPEHLPRYEPRAITIGQLASYVVWPALLIAAIILQQFTFTDEPVLDPAGWSFWWPLLIVLIALKGVWAVWLYRLGSWTRAVTVVNAVLAVATGALLIFLLATGRFLNPAFDWVVDAEVDLRDWIVPIAITVVALSTLWDIADTALRGERARRGVPTKVPGTGGNYTFG